VSVGAGDTQPGTVDLSSAATDPDDDPLSFKVGKASSGLHAEVSGGTLSVTADAEVAKGTDGTVQVSVSDGKNPAVTGTVHVTVVASTRHLPVANEDDVDKALAGKELRIPVLANDTNPFADEGKPLTITGVTLESGDASQPVVRGDEVAVTPDADFHGQIALSYTVQDATKDPERQVDGQVLITVQGHPDTPAKPEVGTIESHQVTLSWTPPNNNGADITSYTVTPSSGAPQTCVTTTCTITGLTNDQEYTFTVVANNAAGASEPSPESDVARPDERPDAPDAPSLEFGDGQLTVTWSNKTYTDRSAIESVNLQISPAAPDGRTVLQGVTGTTAVWKGLENGVAYKVQVQAVNKAPEPSDWGAWSAEETPAGKPAAPGTPTVTRTSLGTTSQMKVDWNAPNDNGGDITGYDIEVLRGGSSVKSVTADASATSTTVDVTANTTDYTFRVRATNKATAKFGDADWSPQSAAVRAFALPPAPTGLTAKATAADGQVQLAFDDSVLTGTGLNSGEVSYQYSAGNGWSTLGSNRLVTGLNNGTPYTFQVRGVASVEGTSEAGQASGSASATPYGPPRTPGVGASGNAKSVTLTWTDPGSNGHGYTLQISVDGGAWETVSGGGSRTVGDAYSESHSIKARTVETGSGGRTATSDKASASSGAEPTPHVTVSSGPQTNVSGCSGSVCHAFNVTASANFPSGSHTIECFWTYGGVDHSVTGHGYTETLNAGATITLPCVAGHQKDAKAWVTVDGVSYKDDAITWPN
jgi:hypothetical protein